MSFPSLRTAALAGAVGLLAGCVAPPPPMPMPLAGGGACAREVAEYNAIAGFFGPPDPLSPPAETLQVELQSESNALERLQIAFGTLVQCRQAEAKVAPGAMSQLGQDAAQAALVRDLVEARGRRLDAAVDRAAPGAGMAISSALAVPATQAVTGMRVELRLQPDLVSAIIARLPPGTRARVQPGPNGFALADAGPDAKGYAPASAFISVPEIQAGSPLVSLAATGAARRAAFAQSVAMATRPVM